MNRAIGYVVIISALLMILDTYHSEYTGMLAMGFLLAGAFYLMIRGRLPKSSWHSFIMLLVGPMLLATLIWAVLNGISIDINGGLSGRLPCPGLSKGGYRGLDALTLFADFVAMRCRRGEAFVLDAEQGVDQFQEAVEIAKQVEVEIDIVCGGIERAAPPVRGCGPLRRSLPPTP